MKYSIIVYVNPGLLLSLNSLPLTILKEKQLLSSWFRLVYLAKLTSLSFFSFCLFCFAFCNSVSFLLCLPSSNSPVLVLEPVSPGTA